MVQELHVYMKNWDIAAPGFKTTYFSNTGGILRYICTLYDHDRMRTVCLWSWAFAIFYFFFTPMCGVMFHCGCQIGASKWAQVKTCNIFKNDDNEAKIHRCPWCTCKGLSCIFVSSDSKAFKAIPLLDLLPDGFFVTFITVLMLYFLWSILRKLGRNVFYMLRSPPS